MYLREQNKPCAVDALRRWLKATGVKVRVPLDCHVSSFAVERADGASG
jgi:hypothetical protein